MTAVHCTCNNPGRLESARGILQGAGMLRPRLDQSRYSGPARRQDCKIERVKGRAGLVSDEIPGAGDGRDGTGTEGVGQPCSLCGVMAPLCSMPTAATASLHDAGGYRYRRGRRTGSHLFASSPHVLMC